MNIEDILPRSIKISQGSVEFCWASIDIVRELVGQQIGKKDNVEWESYPLIQRGDAERVIRRIIPAEESFVHGSHVFTPGAAYNRSIDDRLREMQERDGVLYVHSGFLHSHAGFSMSFSSEDRDTFASAGPAVARQNQVYKGFLPFRFFEKQPRVCQTKTGQVTLSGDDFDPMVIETFPESQKIAAILRGCGIEVPEGINYADLLRQMTGSIKKVYSECVMIGIAQAIVVDAGKTTPFGILGYLVRKPLSCKAGGEWFTKELPVEVVAIENDMVVNRGELRRFYEQHLHILLPPKQVGEYPKREAGTKEIETAEKFIFTAAAYVTKTGAPDRFYAHYLAEIIDKLPEEGIRGTVERLGPLSNDPKPLQFRHVNYQSALDALPQLFAQDRPDEYSFVVQFGNAASMPKQNQVLKRYVTKVMAGKND